LNLLQERRGTVTAGKNGRSTDFRALNKVEEGGGEKMNYGAIGANPDWTKGSGKRNVF